MIGVFCLFLRRYKLNDYENKDNDCGCLHDFVLFVGTEFMCY